MFPHSRAGCACSAPGWRLWQHRLSTGRCPPAVSASPRAPAAPKLRKQTWPELDQGTGAPIAMCAASKPGGMPWQRRFTSEFPCAVKLQLAAAACRPPAPQAPAPFQAYCYRNGNRPRPALRLWETLPGDPRRLEFCRKPLQHPRTRLQECSTSFQNLTALCPIRESGFRF
jgi:hypothetical protein